MTAELLMRDTGVMPRRPPKIEAGPDEWAAWRVAYERERRDWSLTELARRVTEAGAPMQHQAVWQIENRQPPRRISYGEAVAFCKVLEIDDVAELGKPPAEIAGKLASEVTAALTEWSNAGGRLISALDEAGAAAYGGAVLSRAELANVFAARLDDIETMLRATRRKLGLSDQ